MHRLVVTAGPDEKRVFVLSRLPMTIGRGYEAQIRLADGAVSRLQARIERGENAAPAVVDLDSTNGTRVNGQRMQTRTLLDGDQIAFGRTVLRFEADDSSSGGLDVSHCVAIDSDEHTLLGDVGSVQREPTSDVHQALLGSALDGRARRHQQRRAAKGDGEHREGEDDARVHAAEVHVLEAPSPRAASSVARTCWRISPQSWCTAS